MRVTELTVIKNLIENINKTRERLNETQLKIATGKNINTVSDDPYVANSVMNLRSMINRNERFQKNINDSIDFLTATGDAVDNFINTLTDVKSLLVEIANPARQPDYQTYANRLNELFKQLLDSVNTRFRGKYIFNGTKTDVKPFDYNENTDFLSVDLSNGVIEFEVNDGVYEKVNFTVEELFGGREIFDLILQIKNLLRNGTRPSDSLLQRFNEIFEFIVSQASNVGALMNRFLLLQKQIEKQNTILREILSIRQDTDMAQQAINLQRDRLILESAYAVAGRIVQKTIIDYLR
ncbi:flagellar hook-associated protein 3 FlgL [Candidatus Kryptonium thompsonii]|uniref:Flagellar hook-associated protein 3 FlgL n=2 Tax=Candidatus Kryptonium thompsonii TaxID=1633631 RepID=A0A0P1LR83_9BACT|nr:flagellar hook-associated protein FlgL [Candidatus Kryptonium thompsoni]CUS76619.1 flagellar hook-associated protein 3 FlgL [Candidatus Kryptonium thompsoni]CUS82944.1 flagellar hook-associated protein 3 FlgL [Candidatus Kryptonium thompsoni]CUS84351.1 flagellar hook-associated protein 3 FlgL [Candidatus Kryptonium thompsoni]CUS94462.1 flagellar hook-associated protein 3 FlgL [Candidatus Kryptonium thompsoni]CUS95548.1 flagellar hook-associated protein 3 FlgL [Candidatus Kryptonium thompson